MAKILVHGEGLGAPTPDQVRQRAQELAEINGHAAYTEADWHQAKVELHGAHNPEDEQSDEMATPSMVSEADMTSVDVGRHTARVLPEDARNLVAELYQEGMEEAEHERMLGASRAQAEEDPEE